MYTPDIDRRLLTVKAELSETEPGDMVEVSVYDKERLVGVGKSINNELVEVMMPEDMKLWSPESPFLYTLRVTLKQNGTTIDKVNSYAAMRKYSMRRDADGIVRLELNNKALFQFGPLDQGWWPDGLYTAPTDEALLYDIRKTKDLGFNMIRKHIKVEPARWYTHCDKVGIIVWQDMPSGDRNPEWQNQRYFFFFNDTATTEIYTLSLHDALPIYYTLGDLSNVYSMSYKQNDGAFLAGFLAVRDRKITRLNSSYSQ